MTDTPAKRSPSRRWSSTAVVGAVIALVTLSGCTVGQVDNEAASSDGLRVELGDLLMSDIMVLSAAEGQPGTVLGAVKNTGDAPAEVSIGLPDGQTESFDVASDETLLLGPEDHPVPIRSMPVPPGSTVDLVISSTRDGSTRVPAPVLDGTFPRYADLVPSPLDETPAAGDASGAASTP